MLSIDRDADAAVETRIRIGWNKFRQLVPLRTNIDISLKKRRRLYNRCVQSTLWTIKRAPFLCWEQLSEMLTKLYNIWQKYSWENLQHIFVLCCSPHLFSVVTLPQENKVPFNYACTCECVPLSAAIMLMKMMYRLNKTIQIHKAYVSVITCVHSVKYATVMASRPLVDGLVNCALERHCRPHFNQSLLQLAHVLNWWLVHMFLQQPLTLVIIWVEIWTVGRPQILTNDSVCFPSVCVCVCVSVCHSVCVC